MTTQTLTIGGTALANVIDETRLVGALTGTFQGGARAEITKQEETEYGLLLDLEHYFYNDIGGLLHTKDEAKLTRVEGQSNVYMLEIIYQIQDASGAYEGYTGSFQSAGLIDLNIGKVVLRYNGKISK